MNCNRARFPSLHYRKAELSKMRRKDCATPSPFGRRWPEGPDEGGSLALTRRFAAPAPRGRGTSAKPGSILGIACKPRSAWISGDSPDARRGRALDSNLLTAFVRAALFFLFWFPLYAGA